MAAYAKFFSDSNGYTRKYTEELLLGKPRPDATPHELFSITLDSVELIYAQSTLGAAKVNKDVVTYYGDEARRIFFNW